MTDETPDALAVLREAVAEQRGLAPELAGRLRGSTRAELELDADELADALAAARHEPAPTRDQDGALYATPGSFAGGQRGGWTAGEPSMNDVLREMARGGDPRDVRAPRTWGAPL